jgi:UDP-glucuronate decarboxylase
MRILVTGAAGFIGSHLVERLLIENHEVIGIDNLYSGSIENLSGFRDNPNFQFYEHDVNIPYSYNVDYIFNLACPASPIYYQKDPVATVTTNVLGAINALNLARELDCYVFQASTSEVYGDPLISPQTESYLGNVNPIGIRACYDEGKRIAETLFFDYHRQYGVRIKIVRIFNTYGPRMRFDDGRVVSNFICQSLDGNPITIYGNGKQTRSFCYISDLIDGFLLMMNSKDGVTGPLNIGNSREFTMNELAELVIKGTKTESEIRYETLPMDDPKQRQPDLTQAKSLLGYEAQIDLVKGLGLTIDDFKSRRKSKS